MRPPNKNRIMTYARKRDEEGEQIVGHRANCILIEKGQTHIYFTRFGALSIPAVVLEGPEALEAYMQKQTPVTTLLDNVWAEGGVLMDQDKRSLCFYSDGIEKYCIRYLVEAVRLVWEGWDVTWATLEMAEFAHRIGIESATVLTGGEADLADLKKADVMISSVPRQQAIEELISVLTRDHPFTPTAFYQALTHNRENVTVGTGFWNESTPSLTAQQREKLLQRLFAHIE